jgi:uncharacterized protein
MLQNRKELLAWLESHPKLSPLLAACGRQEGGQKGGQEDGREKDAAHDLSHFLRVALWTMRLAPEAEKEEAAAAALLHDLVNLPKDHPERAKASQYSAERAAPLLREAGFSPEAQKRICEAIEDHSFSRGATPRSALGEALQDADRLEALGAIGLMRLFSTGAKMKADYFHTDDPWAESRPLNDKKYSLDHFFTKLLKLPLTFRTERGRMEAIRRARRMEEFLDQTAEEIGAPRP